MLMLRKRVAVDGLRIGCPPEAIDNIGGDQHLAVLAKVFPDVVREAEYWAVHLARSAVDGNRPAAVHSDPVKSDAVVAPFL